MTCRCDECRPTRKCRCGAKLGYGKRMCAECACEEADHHYDSRKDERLQREGDER